MRYFYDTEFLENGHTIELISIGIVAEDGREYYAVNAGMPLARIYDNPWLVENVVPSLPQRAGWKPPAVDTAHPLCKRTRVIGEEVQEFLLSGEGKPELWAYYAAYDHVVFCQLWGRMIDLPDGVPMFTNDIKQECDRLGNPKLPEQGPGEHNALSDARHNKVMFDFLTQHEREGIAALRRVR